MKSHLVLISLLLWTCTPVVFACAASDPENINPSPSARDVITEAQAAIARGDVAEGERLLNEANVSPATRNDVDFLYGVVALEKKEYLQAIKRFNALLVRDSSLNRVRLELARAYFLRGDDSAATYHFRAALAQGLPPAAEKNVEVFLDAIRRRKRWEASVFLAAVPDSNINASTTAQSVDIFGLPFELSDAARRRSGIGLAVNLNAGYQWDIAGDTKLRAGAIFYDTEYTRRMFTDRQIGLYTGPRFQLTKDTDVSILATAARRWYGDVPLTTGGGGRIELRSLLSPRWLIEGAFAGQYLHYNAARYPSYSGPVYGLTGAATYALSPISFLRANAGVVREQTAVGAFRNYQYTAGASYYREGLPGRFAVFGGVQSSVAQYDAALGAFGAVRRDLELSYRLSLSNKYVDLFGFTPVVSFVHTDRTSNVPLYGYHRNRGEIGVVRNY